MYNNPQQMMRQFQQNQQMPMPTNGMSNPPINQQQFIAWLPQINPSMMN